MLFNLIFFTNIPLHVNRLLLKQNKVDLSKLVVSQTLSREPGAYWVKSPTARAAFQLLGMGWSIRPGMNMRFIYVCGKGRVKALGVEGEVHADMDRYIHLLNRAADEVLGIVHGFHYLEYL